jgi:hypothetical protein
MPSLAYLGIKEVHKRLRVIELDLGAHRMSEFFRRV